jgi:polyhydroxybutyrate depolymerase
MVGAGADGCASPDADLLAVGDEGSFDSGGEERAFSLSIPPDTPPDRRLPLIVNMPGARATRSTHEAMTRLAELGRAEGFIVVTPQARGEQPIWNLFESGPDLPFVESLIDHLVANLCVDTDRIYLTGFSAGGMMGMTLACRQPDRYAAVAVVAGLTDVAGCEGRDAVPLLAFHGTADDAVHFDGTYARSLRFLVRSLSGPPRTEIARSWATANGCRSEPGTQPIPPDVEHLAFDCGPDAAVELYVIEDGNHSWPGSALAAEQAQGAGHVTATIDATELVLQFFERHAQAG